MRATHTASSLAAAALAALCARAGDLTVEGSLTVASNLSARAVSAGALEVGGDVLAHGALACADLVLGCGAGRIVAGSVYGQDGLEGVDPDAYGAMRSGWFCGAQQIGQNAYGAVQAGGNDGDMAVGVFAVGAVQRGYNTGVLRVGQYAIGAAQAGVNQGVQSVGEGAWGASQSGWNEGHMSVGPEAHGAAQAGYVAPWAAATNAGRGSLQLLDLAGGQRALVTGHASLGLGACLVTNDQAVVAGDGLASRGRGTVTAVGFYGGGGGLTGLDLSAYAGANLTWSGGMLHAAAGGAGYTDAQAVSAVTSADLDMNAHRVTGLAAPCADGDAATKAYLRQVLSALPPQGGLSMGAYTNGAPASFPLTF